MESAAILERIEDSFKININDEELESIHTIKDLCNCVIKRLGNEKSGSCISAYVFYRVRKILVDEMRYEKSLIDPKINCRRIKEVSLLNLSKIRLGFKLHKWP
jgi:hypothetical protein